MQRHAESMTITGTFHDGQAMVHPRTRVIDYVTLMKPELTLLSMLSALCGYYMGSTDSLHVIGFVHTAIGTTLLGGGVGALNMFIERDYDAMMKRTERRPLPSGRLLPRHALLFGLVLSIIGIVELMTFTNELTGVLAIATFVSYIFIYTPAKRRTEYSTLLGGIPGSLPPLIGWTAARGSLDLEGWVLFAILFCWQMPHFYGLAWMYRKDYARAGYKMLTVVDPTGKRSSRHTLLFTLGLFPATMLTSMLALTGTLFAIGATVLNIIFLLYAIRLILLTSESGADNSMAVTATARRLFFASLWYLPSLMILMCISKR